jgi:3-(3-hydroxy-phenyl)propionate hydroxylase
VLFAGDAAHQVSPFGARGANTGVQDIDNLVWKLKLVIDGHAPVSFIDSYHEERAFAADDNLRQSTRSTDFITPKSHASRVLRDAVLVLAETEPFARTLVNSGRLSTPTPYLASSLNTPDAADFAGLMKPGTNCADAPIVSQGQEGWLLNQLGEGFTVLVFGDSPGAAFTVPGIAVQVKTVGAAGSEADIVDRDGLVAARYGAQAGTTYLIRPDQHVAARWKRFDADQIQGALARCLCH